MWMIQLRGHAGLSEMVVDIKTDSLCVCLSGLGVTLAVIPESSAELNSVRLTRGSGATWHRRKNTGTCRAERAGCRGAGLRLTSLSSRHRRPLHPVHSAR